MFDIPFLSFASAFLYSLLETLTSFIFLYLSYSSVNLLSNSLDLKSRFYSQDSPRDDWTIDVILMLGLIKNLIDRNMNSNTHASIYFYAFLQFST